MPNRLVNVTPEDGSTVAAGGFAVTVSYETEEDNQLTLQPLEPELFTITPTSESLPKSEEPKKTFRVTIVPKTNDRRCRLKLDIRGDEPLQLLWVVGS